MLVKLINQEFQNLSVGEVLEGLNSEIKHLLKIQKADTPLEAFNFIRETLTKQLDPVYRQRFETIKLGINPNGLGLSRSFTRNLKKEMALQSSLYYHFADMSQKKKYNAKMKHLVHNAKDLHAALPKNSGLTLTL